MIFGALVAGVANIAYPPLAMFLARRTPRLFSIMAGCSLGLLLLVPIQEVLLVGSLVQGAHIDLALLSLPKPLVQAVFVTSPPSASNLAVFLSRRFNIPWFVTWPIAAVIGFLMAMFVHVQVIFLSSGADFS